jgi:hypothetical protein
VNGERARIRIEDEDDLVPLNAKRRTANGEP